MSTLATPAKKGDRVAYYVTRKVSDPELKSVQIRKVGIVQGARDGKVVVLHKGGYTELVADVDLYLID